MKDSKKKLILFVACILLLLVVMGGAYAIVIFTGNSSENSIKTGRISMNYEESSNVINITNALPISEDDGRRLDDYFEFSVSSNATTNSDDNDGVTIPYSLIIEPKVIDSDKESLDNGDIKVYLTKVVDGVEESVVEPSLISALSVVNTNFNLYITENVHKNGAGPITTKYRLRAWIDGSVDASNFNTKSYQYKFSINVNSVGDALDVKTKPIPKNTADFEKLVGYDGLIKQEHVATEQVPAGFAYRYTGAEPINYIKYNDELWRIIGIFDVDDGEGNVEKRIKILRESLGAIPWHFISGTECVNEWPNATSKELLNSGDYWNRTGSYSTTGLTDDAKSMIDNAKWYLGTPELNNIFKASEFYSLERSTETSYGHSISWVGKVGLMYPSDYVYAIGENSNNTKEECFNLDWSRWSSPYSDCYTDDWLFTGKYQWTITPRNWHYDAIAIEKEGYVGSSDIQNKLLVRPSVYLKSDIKIIDGIGTKEDPYIPSL